MPVPSQAGELRQSRRDGLVGCWVVMLLLLLKMAARDDNSDDEMENGCGMHRDVMTTLLIEGFSLKTLTLLAIEIHVMM